MKPTRLNQGDKIGIIAPAYAVTYDMISGALRNLEGAGFQIELGPNVFADTYHFAGSIEERAADFNAMIADPTVKMILFGGGEVCNEILPYIDYEAVKANPKILLSYSDGTTILNAITSMTGLVTFYGSSPNTFADGNEYNWRNLDLRLMSDITEYIKSSPWRTIRPGKCTGELTGGYLVNYAALQGLKWFELKHNDYILFLEDHEGFGSPAVVAKWLTNLEHRGVFEHVKGLIFGHYSERYYPEMDEILWRIGERYDIPVVKCEDFGHGVFNAIIPIGITATLDTEYEHLGFHESGVI